MVPAAVKLSAVATSCIEEKRFPKSHPSEPPHLLEPPIMLHVDRSGTGFGGQARAKL